MQFSDVNHQILMENIKKKIKILWKFIYSLTEESIIKMNTLNRSCLVFLNVHLAVRSLIPKLYCDSTGVEFKGWYY